jgi:hypothetical protein
MREAQSKVINLWMGSCCSTVYEEDQEGYVYSGYQPRDEPHNDGRVTFASEVRGFVEAWLLSAQRPDTGQEDAEQEIEQLTDRDVYVDEFVDLTVDVYEEREEEGEEEKEKEMTMECVEGLLEKEEVGDGP